MNILISALALYFLAFVIQVIVWRTALPKSQTRGILVIYTGLLGLFLLAQALHLFDGTSRFHLSLIECVYLTFAYMAVLANYAILYGLIEVNSPSSLMALALDAAGEKGLPKKVFNRFVTNELFIWNRIDILEKGGHIARNGDRYVITPAGARYMHFFLIPRYLMARRTYGG